MFDRIPLILRNAMGRWPSRTWRRCSAGPT